MKRLIPHMVVVALLLSGTAAAQNKAPALSPSSRIMTIFGSVSDDGKTLVAKNTRSWSITNPSMVAGREGHRVKIRSRFYSDTRNILVLSVTLIDAQTQYAPNTNGHRRSPPPAERL
jgi:hypothetical protein